MSVLPDWRGELDLNQYRNLSIAKFVSFRDAVQTFFILPVYERSTKNCFWADSEISVFVMRDDIIF